MATLVFLHAHPDDEASSTAGTMARAHHAGDRVVWICATNGDQGAVPELIGPDETLADVRRREAEASRHVIGVDRLEFLGYSDSGMTGWESNQNPQAFMNADIEGAARKVAAILDEEDADFLVGYDWHGNYGHPDHVMVHKVAQAARDLAARTPRLFEVTINRDAAREGRNLAIEMGIDIDFDPDAPGDDGNPIGTPEAEINWKIDVADYLQTKKTALACHASQPDAAGILMMPDHAFRAAFTSEHFIEDGLDQPMTEAWPFTTQEDA